MFSICYPEPALHAFDVNITAGYLDDIIASETVGNAYVNATSKINALSMVSNLGCHMNARESIPSNFTSKGSDSRRFDGIFGARYEPLDDADPNGCFSTF